MNHTDPVVVGIDGSEDSLRAVRWAAEFADRHHRELLVLHAWAIPFLGVRHGSEADVPGHDDAHQIAERVLRHGISTARQHRPGLAVNGRLAMTSPAVALKGHSESASAVVIGSHGFGKAGSLMLGSVAVDLAGHTACPLLVIRGAVDSHGPVVVGVDETPRTADAMAFAFREAAARGVGVRAVHSWSLPAIMPDWPGGIADLLHEQERHALESLESMIEPLREDHPDVKVECLTPSGSAGRNLVEASTGAQLVVVGSRGRGGFRGLVLGSTSHTLIHHAECPVAVVPHRFDLEGGDDEGSEDDD